MIPVLFHWGPLSVYSYGLLLAVAFLVSGSLAARAARLKPGVISPDSVMDLVTWAVLGGVVGARLFFVVLNREALQGGLLEIFAIWHGGLVWYGGFAGGFLAAWLYTRVHRLSFIGVLDHLAPYLALGHGIGRIGCFLNGCCYGRVTESGCGVVFPGHTEAVLPTQLFEAAGLFIIAISLILLERRGIGKRPGQAAGAYLVLYGVLRFIIEFYRGDQAVFWLGLTLQQLISAGLFALGLIFLFALRDGKNLPIHRRSG